MSPEQLGNILLAALGISFLIFIHELGHFVAARMFNVRIDTFSIGFGPRLFGFRRGDTDYRISAIPLGGYVKMAGEYGDYDEDAELAPDDLMAKPPWQRLIVFSGGVLVNFAFAFLVFPLAFTMGVPFTAPIIGEVLPGGAAWTAGLQPGDEVLRVNGARIYGFSDIRVEVALGDPADASMLIRRNGQEQVVHLQPTRNMAEGRYEIGIGPTLDSEVTVVEGQPASDAGLRTGDSIMTINGVALDQVDPPIGRVLPQARERGLPLEVRYERDGRVHDTTIRARRRENAEPPPLRLGVLPTSTAIVGLRGLATSPAFPLRLGDVVEAVDGQHVFTFTELIAAVRSAPADELTLTVRRGEDMVSVIIPPDLRQVLMGDDVAFDNDMGGTRVLVLAGGALHSAGLVDGDWLLAIDDKPLASYVDLQERVRDASQPVAIDYRRGADDSTHHVVIQMQPATLWDYGFTLRILEINIQEDLVGAVRAGFDTSINILRTTWVTLVKLFTGEVAAKNLGGIVQISVIGYHFAEWGLAKLLFFLGMLSINLGFINILPIPVLDGGQVMFLLFEKIKGKRLSDRFMNSMQLAGLVAILTLVVYVTYNDIMKLVR